MVKQARKRFILPCLVALLLVSCFVSLFLGQLAVTWHNIVGIFAAKLGMAVWEGFSFSPEQLAVIWFVRLPRIMIALLVGAALGCAGAVMQGIFSNILVDPGLVGVSAGATTGAVIAIVFGFAVANMWLMPLMALAGALVAVALTVFLAMRHGKLPVNTLLLSGVAITFFFNAINSGLLTFMNDQKFHQYLFWMAGGLDYRRWEHLYLALPPIVLGILVLCFLARHLNVLALGEVEAKSVGMLVMQYRLGLLLLASIITSAAVCVSGNIGFVGLVVPHMLRLIAGPDHRLLLPASALAGAIFLVVCDALGRMVVYPGEIRVGIVTAIVGVPYFLYLLRNMR